MQKPLLLTAAFFCCLLTIGAQPTITGKITDSDGEPLIGVNVLEKGTDNGTVSDSDGRYSLRLTRDEATIVFSYVGFFPQEIRTAGRTAIDVTLLEGLNLERVEIVGSRSLNRTVTESPVAIDVINVAELTANVGQLDVNQMLQFAAPSFNANRQSGADGSDHIDPATLRGLGPDQTLVLVNGKRRHQSSLINIFGSRGRGNTGVDLNAIPASAIERIEVLRDGASAQYGSDAIAGVVNVVLKSSVNEFTGNVNAGVFRADPGTELVAPEKEYDGQSFQINGNYGVPIGEEGGFVNITTDYLSKGRTNRPANPDVFDIYRRQYGDAAIENLSTYFNGIFPLSETTSIYAFGGYSHRFTDAFAWTRDPDSDRNIPSIYPNGFDPHITSVITDRSISVGVRSKIKEWDVDVNNTFGANRFHYTIDGTLNASLLERSPTRFDAGGYALKQNMQSINFSRFLPRTLRGTNIAFGAEYRVENYEIFAGEEGSYRNYGIVDSVIDGVVRPVDVLGRAAGSQGFPGFQPANELNEYRSNLAAYLDTEFDFTDRFMVGAAVRFENYNDFGNTFNAKLATRVELTDNIALRASASTGFRAPSLAQIYFNTTFTDFVSGQAIDKIIAKNNSPITRTLCIPALKQETALNLSAGLTARYGSFTATVDGYFVDIKDRVVLTGAFEDTDPDIGAELQALNVGAAQFFTNALDTRSTGLDVILTYAMVVGAGRLQVSYAANFNEMELGDIKTSDKLKGKEDIYFGEREQYFLLASAPNSKMNLGFDYKIRKFNANLRFVRFGEVRLIDFIDEEDIYSPKITTDLTLGLNLSNVLSLHVGSANLFNVYPDAQDTETETGGLWDAVQMGSGGAFYFARLGFKF